MTQAQHTPGPWTVNGAEIEALVDPENSQTYYASICQLSDGWAETIGGANARLIAAAPELLAALQEVTNRGYMFDHDAPLYRQCLDAIAKATRPTD